MAHTKQPGRGWAYTGAILGGAVSIAANIAHSFLPPRTAPPTWRPEPGAVVGAIVWPVFLFVAVEILARTAWPRGLSWHLLKWAGLLPVAGVAAFVSYRHLSGLLQHYGEDTIVQLVGPLAVDGLMIMATGALLAGGRATAQVVHHASASAVFVQPTSAIPVSPGFPPVTPVRSAPVAPAPVDHPVELVVASDPAAPGSARDTPAPSSGSSTPGRPRPANDPVNASGPGTPRPKMSAGLLGRARHVADTHRQNTGAPITAGELAVRMRISTERASELLTALHGSAVPSGASS